jgi:hypothetical protein
VKGFNQMLAKTREMGKDKEWSEEEEEKVMGFR